MQHFAWDEYAVAIKHDNATKARFGGCIEIEQPPQQITAFTGCEVLLMGYGSCHAGCVMVMNGGGGLSDMIWRDFRVRVIYLSIETTY